MEGEANNEAVRVESTFGDLLARLNTLNSKHLDSPLLVVTPEGEMKPVTLERNIDCDIMDQFQPFLMTVEYSDL